MIKSTDNEAYTIENACASVIKDRRRAATELFLRDMHDTWSSVLLPIYQYDVLQVVHTHTHWVGHFSTDIKWLFSYHPVM